MVTPHPVGAPYLIQLFSDLAYVFGRSASLPKFFLCVRVFVVNVHTTFMHPPVELMLTGHSTLAFAGFSCAYNPKGESLSWSSIQDTYFLHWHFPFCFYFFGCFMRYISRWCIEEWLPWFLARLEVNLMTLRVVTFLTPFSHVDVISALSMHPVMLSSLAVFLTSNNCHDRRHHTNHNPFFFFSGNFIAFTVCDVSFVFGSSNWCWWL